MQIFRLTLKQFHCPRLVAGALIGLAICAGSAEAQVEIFEVTNPDDAGAGSLRQAIEDANASTADTKTITFSGVDDKTIILDSALPDIADGVTIDGSTAVNLIVDGSGGGVTRIFRVGAETTTVRDLALEGAPIEIANGASLSFDVRADPQIFNEVITDAGNFINDAVGLIKEGEAKLELRGANDYTGGTLIREGVLRGDTTSLQGNIAVESGGRVVFDDEVDATFAGNLTGAGDFTKAKPVDGTGTGTLTLTGVNTLSGQSKINFGAIQGSFASIPQNLLMELDTLVIFDGEDDGTYAGAISGIGAVTKIGDGTLTFSGTHTYEGVTTVSAGTLIADPLKLPNEMTSSIVNNAALIFNSSGTGTYQGVISGTGSLTKMGEGTLSLSGINTFDGLTSITGGRLDVDGELAGNVNVGASTVLGGTGDIFGSVSVDGTVAPGNSIGPLTVASVDFASGSVFEVEVEDLGMGMGNSDLLVVTGNADLAGASVLINPGAGFYVVPVEVTILETGVDLTTEFASFGPDFAFLTVTPDTTDARSVVLTIERNALGLEGFAGTPNQSTIAAALEEALAMGTDPDIVTVFESLNVLTVDEVSSVFDSMTGETLTQFATTRLAAAERFGRSLDARIRDHQWETNDAFLTAGTGTGEASHSSADLLRPASKAIFGLAMLGVGPMGVPSVGSDAQEESRIRAWIDGSGIYGDVDGNTDESGFDYTIWSGSLGADVLLDEHWVLGLAGGYANTDLDFSSRPGDGEVDTYQGAVYAGYVDPRFHVGVSGRYAYNEMDGKREIRFGEINREARADLDGNDYGARLESGLNLFEIGGIVIQPTASVNYNRLTQDAVTEDGADSLNLALEDSDLDSLVTGAGMRVRGRWNMESDLWMVAELHGRWLHEFLDTDRFIEARLVSAPVGASSFQIQGVELSRDSGSVGLSWSVITDSDWSIIGSYDVVLNEDLVQHMGSLTLNFEW